MAKTTIEIIPESIKLVRLTDEQYFSKKYSEYISNSKLGLINPDEGGSIDTYKAGYSNEYSKAFELGSAVHAMVLQPDDYEIAPIRKPTGKLGLFADKVFELEKTVKGINREKAIELASIEVNYYAGKLSTKRLETALTSCEPYWKDRREYEYLLGKELLDQQIYLSSPIFETYSSCMNSIYNNPLIKNILYPTGFLENAEVYNEYALFAEVIVTLDDNTTKRLKLKSKLDNFTINHETQTITLNDLKTTGKPVKYFMGNKVRDNNGDQIWYDGSFQKFHYYRQMGMYLWLMGCYLKHKGINYTPKVNMVVVETIPEFKTRICPVNGSYIKKGLDELKHLLTLVAENE